MSGRADQPAAPAGDGAGRIPVSRVIRAARRDLEQLTGRPVDSVSSVRRDGDGWVLDLEIVELERVPASTSVLGSYRVILDREGEIVEYQRTHRYYRNQATDGEGL